MATVTSLETARRSSGGVSDETVRTVTRGSRTPWAVAAVLAVALALVGGLWWADDAPDTGTAATRAMGAGYTGVTATNGTTTCRVLSRLSRSDQDNLVITERFECENVMSDPRVSGTYRSEITSVYEPASSTTARYASETSTLTNADGVWRGPERGVSYFDASRQEAYNYGHSVFVGEGAYQGLVFHCLVSGTNADLVIAGWIEAGQ